MFLNERERNEDMESLSNQHTSHIKPSKRPKRVKRISDDEVLNLSILLNTEDPIDVVNRL